jgi:hypothetical protein
MSDEFSEVSSKGWFSRLADAFKSVLIGLVLIVAMPVVLFVNEGNSVHTAQGLDEGLKVVTSSDPAKVDSAHDKQLVHMSGKATTTEKLTDAEFGIEVSALRLKRVVEMYQWEETSKSEKRKKLGGGEETVTTYDYNKTWLPKLVLTSSFQKKGQEKHQNPTAMPYEGQDTVAKVVTLGAHTLTDAQVAKASVFEKLPITSGMEQKVASSLQGKLSVYNGHFFLPATTKSKPEAPVVGDVQISYELVPAHDISIVAVQSGATFEPYSTKTGTTIDLLEQGTVSAPVMFERAQAANVMFTWIVRIAGFIFLWLGISMVFSPLVVVADVIPLFGDILGAGAGFFAFLIAAPVALITIGVAWLAYRPLIGGSLIALAIAVFVVCKGQRPKKLADSSAAV